MQAIGRRIDLVGQSDLGQGDLDAIDLGGRADQSAVGLAGGGGDLDLQIMDQGDQEAACVGAELGGLFRARDPQGRDLGILGGPGRVDGLE